MRLPTTFLAIVACVALTACVTAPVLHTQAQLNSVGTRCGLALGELIQDEMEKKVLIALRTGATAQQRVCVTRWARRNGLKPVFVDMRFSG